MALVVARVIVVVVVVVVVVFTGVLAVPGAFFFRVMLYRSELCDRQ